MQTPRALVFARGDARIVVDGYLSEWPVLPAIRLDDTRQLSGTATGSFTGPTDLNAQAFAMWDEEYLWFAAVVRDDRHLFLTQDTPQSIEIPPTDAIELTFDPERDSRSFGPDDGRNEDRSFWLGASDIVARNVISLNHRRGTAQLSEGAKLRVTRDDDAAITTYEAAIPWAEIFPSRGKASVDDILDLQIVVSDYDVPLDPLPDTRIGWTFGTGARIDPGLFGSIRLSGREAGSEDPFEMPEFPAPERGQDDPVPAKAYWVELHERLRGIEAKPVLEDTADPSLVSGEVRKKWLATLEGHCDAFPRVDYLRYHMCTNRRMVRECAGMIETGLPFYWDHVLRRVARDAQRDSPEKGYRLYRLPHGAWLVRSKQASFLIDPAGFAIEKHLANWCDFSITTNPVDPTQRSDQLSLRLLSQQPQRRPFFHILHSLPGLRHDTIEVAEPGETYEAEGLVIKAIGRTDERGWVTGTLGYRIDWPDGASLVVSGLESFSEDVGAPPDIAIVAAQHKTVVPFAHRVRAGITVLDDVLECARRPGAGGRVTLDDAYHLQRRFRPNASIILAPGQSIESADYAR